MKCLGIIFGCSALVAVSRFLKEIDNSQMKETLTLFETGKGNDFDSISPNQKHSTSNKTSLIHSKILCSLRLFSKSGAALPSIEWCLRRNSTKDTSWNPGGIPIAWPNTTIMFYVFYEGPIRTVIKSSQKVVLRLLMYISDKIEKKSH